MRKGLGGYHEDGWADATRQHVSNTLYGSAETFQPLLVTHPRPGQNFGVKPRYLIASLLCTSGLVFSAPPAPASADADPAAVAGDTLFFTGESKTTATARLLRTPSEPPQLKSANGTLTFELGKDYAWTPETRTLTLTAESRIPFKTTAELYPPAQAPQAYKHRRNSESWMLYGAGRFFHDRPARPSQGAEASQASHVR
jgi:hypothetical protein